jgi:serine/threonine protein kinase
MKKATCSLRVRFYKLFVIGDPGRQAIISCPTVFPLTSERSTKTQLNARAYRPKARRCFGPPRTMIDILYAVFTCGRGLFATVSPAAAQQADPTARERFWREAHMTARLDHPNIVPIFEVGEHDGQLFLALEFVAGPSLSDQLRKSAQPPRQAAALVETIARAVHHAHRHGIVHRDLKPANVLLAIGETKTAAHTNPKESGHGQLVEYTPKITDFGLAIP